MPTEFLLLTIAKALVELAAMFLFGRGMLYVLAGQNRETNYFYLLLKTLTSPVIAGARWLTPKFVLDRHIPYVAGLLLFWIWLGVIALMAGYCSNNALDCKALKQGTAMSQPVPGRPS